MQGIDPGALVSKDAEIASTAYIGPDVVIGAGTVVGPGAVIGLRDANVQPGAVSIGEGCHIGPGVVIEPRVTMEAECQINAGSIVCEGSRLGSKVYMGFRSIFMPDVTAEDNARILSNVYVCEGSLLRSHCQIMPSVLLINDLYPPTAIRIQGPVVGECAVIGVNSVIGPGVTLGYHAMVATFSEVHNDVPDYVLVRGRPATPVCDVRMIRANVKGDWIYPYPWMRHQIPGEDLTKPVPEAEKRNLEILRQHR